MIFVSGEVHQSYCTVNIEVLSLMHLTLNYQGGFTVTEDVWRESLHKRLDRVESEVVIVKNKVISIETQSAVDEVHRNNVEHRLGNIEGVLTKLTWLIISGLIVALMAFIVGGGLSLV
jgi:hypothetical protein